MVMEDYGGRGVNGVEKDDNGVMMEGRLSWPYAVAAEITGRDW